MLKFVLGIGGGAGAAAGCIGVIWGVCVIVGTLAVAVDVETVLVLVTLGTNEGEAAGVNDFGEGITKSWTSELLSCSSTLSSCFIGILFCIVVLVAAVPYKSSKSSIALEVVVRMPILLSSSVMITPLSVGFPIKVRPVIKINSQ